MKKFTTLICALSVILGVCATPFHSPKPEVTERAKMEKALRSARTDRERQAIVSQYKAAQRARADRQSGKADRATRAPKAALEATKVTITRISYLIYAEDNTIYYGLHTNEFAPAFYFEIPIAPGTHDVELGRTYSLADMTPGGCEWDDEDWNQHYYTAATFTKTKGQFYDVHIAATITDTDGKEWVLAYDEPELIPTGDTVTVSMERTIESIEYIGSDNSWLMRAHDNDYFVQLAYFSDNSTSVAGRFTANDISLSETYIGVNTGELDEWEDPIFDYLYAKDGTLQVVEGDNGRVDVTASLLLEDGKVYNLTLFYALPEKESEAGVTADNLNMDDWALALWGELSLSVENKEGVSVALDLYPDDPENILVSYELSPQSRNSGHIITDGEVYDIYTGTVTLAHDSESARYILTGKVLAWNNVEYTLDLRTPVPVVTEEEFVTEDLVLDIYESNRAWQIAGFDSAHARFLTIGVYADNVAGSYTEADMEPEVTYLATYEAAYVLSSASIQVAYSDSIAGVTGTMLFVNQDDRYDYLRLTLDIKAHPYVPSVRDVTVGDFAFSYNETDGEASVYYELLTVDKGQLFIFDFPVERWTPEIEFGKEYTYADMNPEYSRGMNYSDNEMVNFQTATFKKTQTGDTTVLIEAHVTDQRGNTWNITYQGADKEISAEAWIRLGQANLTVLDGDGGLQYEMVDVDNTFKCVLSFNLPGAEDVEPDSLYGVSTIELEYSFLSFNDNEYKITDAAFIKSVYDDASEITAAVTDERGFVFHLTFFDGGFVVTGDTVQIVMAQPLQVTYQQEYNEWSLYAENDSLIVSFSVEGGEQMQITGDLTALVSGWSSRIERLIDPEENSWSWIQFYIIGSVIVSGEPDHYALDATVTAEDGNVYLIRVSEDAQAVRSVYSDGAAVRKLIRDGRLLIIRDGKTYNATGAVVK